MPHLRKWYFCINSKGFTTALPLIRVAVRSCLARTELQPICLYNGQDQAQIDQLTALGVTVLRHRSSLEPILRVGYGDNFDKFSGHWLRVDIPLIETEDNFVLYTDIDVMFRTHPTTRIAPRFIGAAPERRKWGLRNFNSGVLVMNIPNLRRVHDAFSSAIAQRMEIGWEGKGHDQVSFNRFFRYRYARLPNRLNWKPYWGANPNAQIVHFHGPKPANIAALKSDKADGMLPEYRDLWQKNPAAYELFCDEFETYRAATP